MMDKDRQFRQDIKQTFERQALDPGTARALEAARKAALERPARLALPRWVPATAISCLLLVMLALLAIRGDNPSALPQMTADELALIAGEDELELFEELEFYLWFDQNRDV